MRTTKAELGRIANEVRSDLGLSPKDQFDPLEWSHRWGVPFVSLDDIRDLIGESAYGRFTVDRREAWSAALIAHGGAHVVVYNTSHSIERVRSDLAHEAAHFAAEHVLSSAWLTGERSCGGGNAEQEKEAAELSGQLLIPPSEARVWAIRGQDPAGLAQRYGVSYTMAKWRINESGGTVIRQRSLAKRGAMRWTS